MTAVYATMPATLTDDTGASNWVKVTLAYNPADPIAITMTITYAGIDIIWQFARCLLADGLEIRTGLGDVKIWPDLGCGVGHIGIVLDGADGIALIGLRRATVARFLRRTYAGVPLRRERVDVDGCIAQILGGVR